MKTPSYTFQNFDVSVDVKPAALVVASVPVRGGRRGGSSTRPAWGIEYHAKDAGKVMLKGGGSGVTLRREADTIHLYAPGCCYAEDPRDADFPARETYIVFRDADACGLSNLIDPRLRFARFFDYEKRVGSLLEEAAALCAEHGVDAFWLVQAKLLTSVFRLRQSRRTSAFTHVLEEPGVELTPSFSEEVIEFMRRDPARPLRIADLARYMKVSESTLNHKFKAETGRTPIASSLEIRVDYAKGLILRGERLKNVAEVTGFHDQYHFSKTFKKITGQSPRRFQRR